jgi:predicted kinase
MDNTVSSEANAGEPVILLVGGAPCAGKTTLAARLAHDLRWPFVRKDAIKELLFDVLGWGTVEQSRRLGAASFALIYTFLDIQLAAGQPVVVEANFRPAADTVHFCALQQQYGCRVVQINLYADHTVLLDRLVARVESGQRHPGHLDDQRRHELAASLRRDDYTPLDLDGPVIRVDTTVFERVAWDDLLAQVRTLAGA